MLSELDKQEIQQINQEALTYSGKHWGRDLFIRCLVEDLHFEQESITTEGEAYLKCDHCDVAYVLRPDTG